MTITYTSGIPNGPDNPSNDQPLMKINNDNIPIYVAIDHVGFNVNNSGFHNQIHFNLNEAAPGLGGAVAVEYANIFNGNSWPVWQNALGSTVLCSSPTNRSVNGFASLPGNVLIQWGFSTVNHPGTGAISFNTNFVVVGGFLPVVTIAPFTLSGTAPDNNIFLTGTTNTNFSYNNFSTKVTSIYWHAIGPI